MRPPCILTASFLFWASNSVAERTVSTTLLNGVLAHIQGELAVTGGFADGVG
jgi:hypothetical protein